MQDAEQVFAGQPASVLVTVWREDFYGSDDHRRPAASERHVLPTNSPGRCIPLVKQDDGAELIDIQAWKDAGVPEVLRTSRAFIDRVLKRLER